MKNFGVGAWGRGVRGGALKAKHYSFVGGGGVLLLFFFFQSSGRLAFVKMYNFLQVMDLLKDAVLLVSFVQMRSFGMKKMMNKQNLGFREKLRPGEYTVLKPGKTRLKPRLFLPNILARK